MKNLIFIFIILISTNIFAQSGYLPSMQEADFKRITEQIKDKPDNYELIWKRLSISNLHFDIYAKERVFVTSSRPFIDKRFAVASCERP